MTNHSYCGDTKKGAFFGVLWYHIIMKTNIKNTSTTGETVVIPRAEYDADKAYISELEQKNRWLMEQLRLLRKKQFGSSSEKTSEEVAEQMSFLFNEAEVFTEEDKEPEAPVVEVRAHERKKSGAVKDILPADVPVETVEHHLTDEERICPQCGGEMQPIGKEVKETLVFKPAEAYLRRDIYYTYACEQCKVNDVSTPVVKANKIPSVIPGSYASPEAIAHIAVQKFVMCSPLYRQEQDWNRKQIRISRQTMANWLIRSASDWLMPIYGELHRSLIGSDIIQSDETSVQVLHEEGKAAQSKSSMWLYRTGGDAEYPIVLYEYRPGKESKYPKQFLEGFHGYLQTDGAQYYNSVDGVIRTGCWAHLRRKFEDARNAMPKGKRSPTAEQGAAYCTKLFELEKTFRDLGPEERKKQRSEQAKPVLDSMSTWAKTRAAAPKSKLGEALTYLNNQWEYLNNYLLDGRIELSNNRAERSIKPFVMSRKNFMFANTPNGAQSSAVIFSLIETAKETGLDPYRYLTWVLSEAPRRSANDPVWASALLPQNAPAECKAH